MKSDRAATRPLRLAVAAASLVLLALTGCPAQQGADTAAAASLALLALTGCPDQQGGGTTAAAPESEEDKAFYTLGYFVMKRASEFELDEREKEMVLSGAHDAVADKEAVVDIEAYQQRLAAIFRERRSRGADAEKLDSQTWVDSFAEKTGAVKTPESTDSSAAEGQPDPDETGAQTEAHLDLA